MSDSEKKRMQLNIGDQRISLTVPANREAFVRATESEVDALYTKWRNAFPGKSDREILTMVAYQYASFYGELKERYEAATLRAEEILREFGGSASDEEED